MKRILMAGAGSGAWWNAGDEAILSAILWQVRKAIPEIEIGLLSANPAGSLEQQYGVREIPVGDVEQLFRFAEQSDLIMLAGGGILFDYWPIQKGNILMPEQQGVGAYLGLALLARLLHKPAMAYGIGVGPLAVPENRQYVKLALEHFDCIAVRDSFSRECLLELGVNAARVHLTADPAWILPEVAPERGERLLEQLGIVKQRPLLGVSLRSWGFPNQNWELQVAQALDRFIEETNFQIVFLSFHKEFGTLESDAAVAQRVRAAMRHATSAYVTNSHLSLEDKLSLLRQSDLVLGMRLHAALMAVRYGIPAVGIAYDPKVTYFFHEIEQSTYCLNLDGLDAIELSTALTRALTHKNDLQRFYLQRLSEMQARAEQNLALMLETLQNAEQQANKIRLVSPPESVDEWIYYLLRDRTFAFSRLKSQREALLSQLGEERAQRETLLSQLGEERAQREMLLAQLGEERAQREALLAQLAEERSQQEALRNQIEEVWIQRQRLEVQVQEQHALIESLRAHLDAFRNSTSWRITRPLRFLKRLLRNPRQALGELRWYLQKNWLERAQQRFIKRSLKENQQDLEDTWRDFLAQTSPEKRGGKPLFVLYSTVDWGFPLAQRPQLMAQALARQGYPVVYHTPNQIDRVAGIRQVQPNIWITAQDLLSRDLPKAVHIVYSTSLYPSLASLQARRFRGDLVVYEYIDRIDPVISGPEHMTGLLEQKHLAFTGSADFIVATARQLEQEAKNAVGEDKVLYIPNAVDVEHYARFNYSSVRLPLSLVKFRRRFKKLVGYFGAIAPWLWYDLLEQLVRARPDIGFVFIGQDYFGGVRRLPKASNVLYLGPVPYKKLPGYARLFDVGFIPFAPGDVAQTTSPLKLFEYFALEKPVVVPSFMNECVVYPEVFSGDTVEKIAEAIERAYAVRNDASYRARLRSLAIQNTWDERAKLYEAALQRYRSQDDGLSKSLLEDILKRFSVSEAFVLEYKRFRPKFDWMQPNWEAFLSTLSSLDRLHVEFTFSTVQRGRYVFSFLQMQGHLPANRRRYLDIGTAYGGFLIAFREGGFQEVVGIEIDDQLTRLGRANIRGVPQARILQGDFVQDDFSALGKFDLITCNDVIEHVSDPVIAIQKIAAMLEPQGLAYLEIPNKDCIDFVILDGHFQIFGITQLERQDAALYCEQVRPEISRERYLREIGEMYELDWYLQQFQRHGLDAVVLPTHWIGTLEEVPTWLKKLEQAYQTWQEQFLPRLPSDIAEKVIYSVKAYMDKLKYDLSHLDSDDAKRRFENKYLRTFWTLLVRKREVQESCDEASNITPVLSS